MIFLIYMNYLYFTCILRYDPAMKCFRRIMIGNRFLTFFSDTDNAERTVLHGKIHVNQ